jgi:protein-L-isoaspartate O-methyltransferase
MAVMLDRLDVRSGHRVLEIGTGTGYNAALLCHRLGPEHVYSIDIDPNLIDLARGHLSEINLDPHLAPGDGANGWADHGPFDRIIATCAVTHIPPAWINQLTDGGRIVAPLDAGDAGPLLVLDKTAPNEVTGRIDPYPAHFMPLRASADNPLGPGHSIGFTGTGRSHYGTTSLDPTVLFATGSTDLALFLWLHSPGLRLAFARELGRVYVHTATSLAEVDVEAVDDKWAVKQSGPARLWDTVEHAYSAWLALGKPGPARLGVIAPNTMGEQFVWLDKPDSAHNWPLPSLL